jgi:steroid delta-isomerase
MRTHRRATLSLAACDEFGPRRIRSRRGARSLHAMTAANATSAPSVIPSYFAAIRAMDREAWVACFAPDGESHDPVGAPPHRGHAGLRAFFDAIRGAVESIALWEDFVAPAGDEVAVAWTMTGRGKNGRAFRFRGVDVFELDASGRIRRVKAYWPAGELFTLLSS